MKGPAVEEEIKCSKNAIRMLGGRIEHIEKVQIEDSDLNHNLVIIRKLQRHIR